VLKTRLLSIHDEKNVFGNMFL